MSIIADGTDLIINGEVRSIHDDATAQEWNPIVESFDTSGITNEQFCGAKLFLVYDAKYGYHYIAANIPEAISPCEDEQLNRELIAHLRQHNIDWG